MNWIRFFDHPRHGLIPCTRATRLNFCMMLQKIYSWFDCPDMFDLTSTSTVFSLHQRHRKWRRIVPSLWLRPQELSFLVQVCLQFCLRAWFYSPSIKTYSTQSQGVSGHFSGEEPRPHWGGSCQPWENGGNWTMMIMLFNSISYLIY